MDGGSGTHFYRVIQPTEDVFASEGDTVTLDCKFETTDTAPSLFWYRQEMGDFPKYLWKSYGSFSGNAPGISDDRFKAAKNGTSVPLKIQKLQLTDSAVYYCALRNTTTLYKNLWREDNTILHNIHQRESLTINWNRSGGKLTRQIIKSEQSVSKRCSV
uniref:Ig-like domain-containing protein n=1 Tax=Labrus bergylta TaxID=56723 RepID=A0A3Q3FVZ6_9LABR